MSEKSSIVIERATAADLPAVVELCVQVEEQHERYWPLRWQQKGNLRERYLNWLGSRLAEPRMLIAVARLAEEGADAAIAGTILITIDKEIPIYVPTEYADVQDMAVAEGFRRRGIGQALLAYAADWARPHGVNQLRLMVANQNPEARGAFEKAGFRATYQEMTLPL